jgi:hypothetical protein
MVMVPPEFKNPDVSVFTVMFGDPAVVVTVPAPAGCIIDAIIVAEN